MVGICHRTSQENPESKPVCSGTLEMNAQTLQTRPAIKLVSVSSLYFQTQRQLPFTFIPPLLNTKVSIQQADWVLLCSSHICSFPFSLKLPNSKGLPSVQGNLLCLLRTGTVLCYLISCLYPSPFSQLLVKTASCPPMIAATPFLSMFSVLSINPIALDILCFLLRCTLIY